MEVSDLMMEIQSLQERVEDTRDKEIIRALRRELEEVKFRLDICVKEIYDFKDMEKMNMKWRR